MGYRKKTKTIKIQFAPGHELYGLEVVMKSMNIEAFSNLTGLDGSDDEGVAGAVSRFPDHLVSWNLEAEDDGSPIPATREAVADLDAGMVLTLAGAWLDGMSGVANSDPLPQSSPSGGPSPVASIPMEPLPENLAS